MVTSMGQSWSDQVYLTGLKRTDRYLYDALRPYFGTDATKAMTSRESDDLRRLYHRLDLVVAKTVQPIMRKISHAELARHRTLPASWPKADINPKQTKLDEPPGVWVSVGDEVYDVTGTFSVLSSA